MWRTPDALARALRQEHQQAGRVTFLDTEFNPVENGTLETCLCSRPNKNVTNFITDGNVDVDASRLIRRTAELTILNPDGRYTPRKTKGDNNPVGLVYLNRLVMIERGVHTANKQHIYVPVGTFMIDIAEVISERNMTVVLLTMSDLAKKISKSYFNRAQEWDKETHYNKIINDVLDDCGFPIARRNIDALLDRDVEDRKTNVKIRAERGQSRGDFIKELADRWDIELFFDPVGIFKTEDRRSNKEVVWSFYASENRDGMLVSVKRSLSDDNLYNHVVVIGTGPEKGIVRAERKDTNPNSLTNIDLIGDRVYFLETKRIGTQSEANRALNRAWNLRFQLEETVTIETICMPSLEANDYVKVIDKDGTLVDDKYRATRFNVPLVSSRQQIELHNILTKDEL